MSKKQSQTDLQSVGELATHMIITKLNPSEVASVACVNTCFKCFAYDDSIWSSFCKKQLNLSPPIDPQGNLCPSFKAAYRAWREAYSASEDEINQLEESLNMKLPLPTRVLYRFCDGQEFSNDELMGSVRKHLCGLLRGYIFADHIVNVFLLPLNIVIQETKELEWVDSTTNRYIMVASSLGFTEKLFFLDCEKGQLFVGTNNLVSSKELMPCVPNGLITSEHDSESGSKQDAMLLWLEEHARRLEIGIIRPRQ
ncbi:F-box protein SKIP16 [Tanacetum coccineum]